MPNLTGQSIGRYHILEQLGEGGMAIVYKAYDTRLERNVALKVLRTDLFGSAIIEQILKRFEREAKSLAKLSHSSIVNILDYGEFEGSPYLVMEYLPGGTLKQKLGHAIPWHEAIQILLPISRGLAYAHQHGVIHRDVKPANVLMKEENIPVLTDFGIAKLLEGADGHTLTASGVGIGTPEYMAPEQGIGASTIDARADIYSLGIVLYEMVTGRKPYTADTPMAVVLKQMTDPLPRPTDFVPDLHEEVEHILFKALAKQPEDRYEDMNSFITAMEDVLTTKDMTEVPISVKRVKKKRATSVMPSPKAIIAIVGVIGVILVIAFGGSWVTKQLSAESKTGVTSTKVSSNPSSTFTIIPPTKTLEPSPSPTLTLTPHPIPTYTSIPVWLANFAEPILASIKDRKPDFQDDFSSNEPNGWFVPEMADFNVPFSIEEGVLHLEKNGRASNIFMMRKPNFVLQVDFTRPSSCCAIVKINGEKVNVQLGPNSFCRKGECMEYSLPSGGKVQIIFIVKNSEAVFYLLGIPVFHNVDSELANYGYSTPRFECTTSSCEIDNVKFWNIDKVQLP